MSVSILTFSKVLEMYGTPPPKLWMAALVASLCAASCTLDREGTGELFGQADDASAGGSAGTAELGGFAGTSAGGTGGLGGSSGSAGLGGNGGTATGGDGGTEAGVGGTSTGGTEAGTGDAADHEVDCLNGIDDDQNGKTDCADAQCQPLYECLATPPAGWSGTFRVREVPFASAPATPDACPDGSPATRYYQDASGQLNCVCGCGPLTGATCNPARLGCSTNTNCGSPADWTSALSDQGCHKPDIGTSGSLSCALLDSGAVVNAGACQPSVTISGEQPFVTIIDVCGTASTSGGCAPGLACAPRAGGIYNSPPCVAKPGNEACPLGWGKRLLGFASYQDTRACSPCTCAPNTSCAGTTYTVYDDWDCQDSSTTIADATCRDASGALDWSTWTVKLTAKGAASGQCTGGGGEATGEVKTEGATTYCCQQ